MVQLIVYDSGSTTINNTPTLTLLLAKNEINFVKSLRQFEVKFQWEIWLINMIFFVCQYAIEMLNVSSTSTTKDQLEQLCNTTIDNSQDFTDSIYISIEQREKVLEYHRKLQEQLAEIIKIITSNNEMTLSLRHDVLPLSIQSIQQVARDFRKQVKTFLLLFFK
jgi:methyl-accepting chemotaxis protein